jgi:hypothetical protein
METYKKATRHQSGPQFLAHEQNLTLDKFVTGFHASVIDTLVTSKPGTAVCCWDTLNGIDGPRIEEMSSMYGFKYLRGESDFHNYTLIYKPLED